MEKLASWLFVCVWVLDRTETDFSFDGVLLIVGVPENENVSSRLSVTDSEKVTVLDVVSVSVRVGFVILL